MKFKHFLSIAVAIFLNLSLNATTPRYIFYFIGDGMGMGHVMATQSYNRTVLGQQKPILMMQFPIAGSAHTYSANTPVTDSAAAGTALATGYKTKNGMLGMNTDTVAVQSIAEQLKAAGYGIGLVTTVAPDDATPGAFYAHVPNRGMFYQIGKDYAASDYEFLAGANLRGTTTNGQPNDLMKILTDSGIQVVRGINSLANTTSRRVILLNTDSIHSNDVGYTIDSIPNVLTLPDMTAACLNHLKKFTPKKFFMMVEGGNIDHAGHANDGATVIKETLNFNQALQLAYDFYLEHPKETLIVVTADHDTGGLSVGNKYTGYNAYLQYIDYQRVSKEAFSDWCHALLRSRRNFTWDDMKEYLTDNFGFWEQVPVDDTQTATLQSLFDKTFNMRNSADQVSLYNSFNEFAVEVFNVMNTVAGIGWTSPHHTGNEVPVFAIGVGADKFASFNNNIDIPAKIRAIAKLK